jgi:hypothetical protein
MVTLNDLPFELLSLAAAAPSLTNHDRKQARLACRKLADVMTPLIFRRAYISWIQADQDAFFSLAAAPSLAVHVEEVVWFEAGGLSVQERRNTLPLLTTCRLRAEGLGESGKRPRRNYRLESRHPYDRPRSLLAPYRAAAREV